MAYPIRSERFLTSDGKDFACLQAAEMHQIALDVATLLHMRSGHFGKQILAADAQKLADALLESYDIRRKDY